MASRYINKKLKTVDQFRVLSIIKNYLLQFSKKYKLVDSFDRYNILGIFVYNFYVQLLCHFSLDK